MFECDMGHYSCTAEFTLLLSDKNSTGNFVVIAIHELLHVSQSRAMTKAV